MKYHGSQAERREIQHTLRRCLKSVPDDRRVPLDVLVTTYSYFEAEKADDRNFLRKLEFSYMVLDEAHCLKNPSGRRYKNLSNFNARHRLLLTGTPIQNDPKELMSLLTFLMKNLFKKKYNTYEEKEHEDGGAGMLTHFVQDMKKNQRGDRGDNVTTDEDCYRKLKTLMAPFILRRKKAKVLAQILPAKKTELVLCEYGEGTRHLYTDVLKRHVADKANAGKMAKGRAAAMSRSVFTDLRKAANNQLMLRTRWTDETNVNLLADVFYNTRYFGSDKSCTFEMVKGEMLKWSDFDLHSACLDTIRQFPSMKEKLEKYCLMESDLFTSPKMQKLRTMLPTLVKEGHRILLFSQWQMIMDLLECLLNSLQMDFYRLDGSTPISTRQSEYLSSFSLRFFFDSDSFSHVSSSSSSLSPSFFSFLFFPFLSFPLQA